MDVRFNLVAPEAVLGALKATGSTDRDVLFAAKEEFAARYRPLRWFGIWALVAGGLATLLVLTAFIGIPLVILGWWWLRRARRNLATIEATYETFIGQVAAQLAPAGVMPMRAVGLVLLVLLAQAGAADAQTDVVPDDQAGDWVPAKGTCDSPMRLVLVSKQATLVNGADRVTHGNVGVTWSYFGESYQGISFVLMPDYDKTQPYLVTFNAREKKGQTTVEFSDATLRKRFPLDRIVLKRCPSGSAAGAGAPTKAARSAAGSACAGVARCVEVRSFTATLGDLRLSRNGNDKVLTFSVRFRNLLETPLYLGFVQGSGLMIDDQGMRYTMAGGPAALKGIGLVTPGSFDPKFVLQAGESGDVRVELVSRAQQGQIFGTVYDLDFAVREIEALPANQFQLGKEYSLQYKRLVPDDAAPVAASALGAATPVMTASAGAPAAPAPAGDACAGRARCYGAGPFVVTLSQIVGSKSGGYQTLWMNVTVRNLAAQPLSLGFQSGTAAATDDTGDRWKWKPDGVKGIGLVTSSAADPQFTLDPGQERSFKLGYYKGIYGGTVLGTSWSADFVLQQLEVLPSRQVRSLREYAISFTDLKATAPSAGEATAGSGSTTAAGQAAGKFVDGLFKKKQ